MIKKGDSFKNIGRFMTKKLSKYEHLSREIFLESFYFNIQQESKRIEDENSFLETIFPK